MITASAQLLEMLPPEAHRESEVDRLQTIIRSAERMDRLIGDLLDISRIEAAHFSVERAPVDTAPLLEEACEVLRSRAAEKALEFRCEVPEDLPPLSADRDRILQVLENLVGNAVRFTPEGGRITLRAQPKDTEVQFSVSDTGPGIAEEQRAHLLDPYWQAMKGTGEGVGLGLPSSEGIDDGSARTVRDRHWPQSHQCIILENYSVSELGESSASNTHCGHACRWPSTAMVAGPSEDRGPAVPGRIDREPDTGESPGPENAGSTVGFVLLGHTQGAIL